MSESNEIDIQSNGNAVVARIEGTQLGEDLAGTLQTQIAAAAEKAGDLPVLIDMSRVEFMPSMSIGALVSIWQKFKKVNRRFILVGLQPTVRETLTICRLDKVFDISDSVEDALSRIRRSS